MESEPKQPLVSVRLTSYQHAKFIGEAIESVLKQTFQDFEIQVTDDCSTDDSVEIIKSFDDPRIHLVVAEHNRGVAATATESLRRGKGKYTACLCSDDTWLPDKLEKQVNFLESNPNYDAVLTGVEIVDDEGKSTEDPVFSHIFSTINQSKEDWLRQFFFSGNSLCMPSAMFRTNIYKALDGQNPTLSGLSDFDLWIRFCMANELYILPEQLTHFRLHEDFANEGGLSRASQRRSMLEYHFIRRHYTEIRDVHLFSQVFPEYQAYGNLTLGLIPYFLARISLDSDNEQIQFFGYSILWEFMQSSANRDLLEKEYGFYTSDLHKYSKQIDLFQIWKVNALRAENQHLAAQLNERQERLAYDVELLRNLRETKMWKLSKPIRKVYRTLNRFSNKK